MTHVEYEKRRKQYLIHIVGFFVVTHKVTQLGMDWLNDCPIL
jgi:hypothetical protein